MTKKTYFLVSPDTVKEIAKSTGNDISYDAIRFTVQKKRKNKTGGVNRFDMAHIVARSFCLRLRQ